MAITVNTTPNAWAGVFNEIPVEFQRKDFQVSSINGFNLFLSGAGSTNLDAGHNIFLFGDDGGGGTDSGFFTILSKGNDTTYLLTSAFPLVSTSGYLNSDDVREDYYLALIAENEVYLKIVPDATGLLSADISDNLVYLLSKENISDYGTAYIQDTNLGKSYELEFTEVYNDTVQTAVSVGTFNVVFAALAYTDMTPYIIEPSGGPPNTFFAKWLTEFEELAYWEGQAFDVAIINAFDSNTLFVKEEKHFTDGSSSTDTIALSNMSDVMLRIQLAGGYASNIDYINLYLFDTTQNRLTEKLRINIFQACDDSMSIAWINTLGGLDYWNFTLRQDYSLRVNTKKTIFLKDSEFDLSKSANNNIKLFADDINVIHQTGVAGLFYCLQAYLYETSSYINVRIDDGESFLYRTDSGKFKIEVEAIKELLNLGHL